MSMEKLVEKSLRQYLDIREKMFQIAMLMQEGQTVALVRAQQEWQTLNAEAQETDRQINDLMQNLQPSEKTLADMDKRKQLMLQIRQQCEKLQQKARTLQALTEEELLRLKKGRQALGGYRASNQGRGQRPLGSC